MQTSVTLAALALPHPISEALPPEIENRLYADMRTWVVLGHVDAFRYEAFAARIRAAVYGRADAVT